MGNVDKCWGMVKIVDISVDWWGIIGKGRE